MADKKNILAPQRFIPYAWWDKLGSLGVNALVYGLLLFYLLPMVFMLFTSFKEQDQFRDRFAPLYPARQLTYIYQGEEVRLYTVPVDDKVMELALIAPGRRQSVFVDPAAPEVGEILWDGNWRELRGVYKFHLSFVGFESLFDVVNMPLMAKNTLLIALITEIAVLVSSVIVAYGFSRFPLPGGNLLFYLLIITILIPEKVTLIPSYFFYVRVLNWDNTWLPIVLPFFFGNAVYIFLLRQNFRSIPKELDEAAMLDGAGPIRTLFSVILPNSWPVVITVSLIHFFYIWNETRLASLYLGTRRDLAPIAFGIQNYQSFSPTQNYLQASALVIMVIPVIVLLLTQRQFMNNMWVTGMEAKDE